jgi:gliding motility-associated-like protein
LFFLEQEEIPPFYRYCNHCIYGCSRIRKTQNFRFVMKYLIYTVSILALCSMLSSSLHAKTGKPTSHYFTTRLVEDTTVVACEDADTAYSTWFNTLQLQVVLPAQLSGNTVTISPTPPETFTFRGPCHDTLRLTFTVKNGGGTQISNATYVFIVLDTLAPRIVSSIADSLILGCKDLVPDSSTVTITDNCALDTVIYNQTIQGSGNCVFRRKYIRTWRAIDACGNRSDYRQVIIVTDTDAPEFGEFPRDTTLPCSASITPESLGRPILRDNCDLNPVLSFTDEIAPNVDPNCKRTYELRRLWKSEDACGNSAVRRQIINVVDNIAPTFTPPRDTIIDCRFAEDPQYSGRPRNIRDNCSNLTEANLSFSDVLQNGTCNNNYIVLRTWRLTDSCGNFVTAPQRIEVIDRTAPEITRAPINLILNCDANLDAEARFNNWLNTLGNALAVDNCTTPSSALRWILQDAQSNGQVTFPSLICSTGSKVILERRVRFIVEDECGNRDTATAIFQVIDDQAPELSNCPANATINTDLGSCTANFTLQPPQVEDICRFAAPTDEDLFYGYSINKGPIKTVPGFVPVQVTLNAGVNLIVYYVRDCAGNTDSCSYTVTVRDRERPEIVCPNDYNLVLATGACTAPLTLPRPVVTDNCSLAGSYNRTLPLDSASAFLTYTYTAILNSYLAGGKLLRYDGVAPNATGDATIIVDYKGDFNSPNAILEVFGENGRFLGSSNEGDASCTQAGQLILSIPRDTFNRWAADGIINLRVAPRRISTPSGQPGEGVNPCNPSAIVNDGDTDRKGYIFANLAYPSILPTYYAQGVTALTPTRMPVPPDSVRVQFAVGETRVSYLILDSSGNADTCTFKVKVRDAELPIAKCKATTLFINPSGLEAEQVKASEIDAGSTDNCAIANLTLTPSTFTCTQAGSVQNVTLAVTDRSGNVARCSTIVRIETARPAPAANSGLCGNDTLSLYANPPIADGGTVFTFRWTGPNGFTSNLQNPIIPRVSSRNAGSYSVEITGITNCKSTGVVEVSIEDLPVTPTLLLTKENYCADEDIILNSSIAPSGTNVTYRWYKGEAPNGTLISQTIVPSFTLRAPHAESQDNYYLTIESAGCVSLPSAPKMIRIFKKPLAIPKTSSYSLCEGQSIVLGTEVAGPGITYLWTGPNGYSSTSQFPPAITAATAANAGVYTLVISRFNCTSDQAFIPVSVVPRPRQPQLTYSGAICEGGKITLRTNSTASLYTWVSPSLEEFRTSVPSFDINNASNAQEGSWRLYLTTQECSSDLSLAQEVIVYDKPKPKASATPPNVCEGSRLELRVTPATPNAAFQWSGPNNYSSVGNTVAIENTRQVNAGRYLVKVTSIEGCVGMDSLAVEVISSIRIFNVTNNAPRCLPGPTDITLSANFFPPDDGNFRYSWTGPNNYTSNKAQAVLPNATQANSGNYSVVITTAGGCASEAVSTLVNVTDPPLTPTAPTLSETTVQPLCADGAITLCTNAYQGNTVTYNWITPTKGIVLSSTPCFSIPKSAADDSGIYSVFVSIDGCNSRESGEVLIQVTPKPSITASTSGPVCQGLPFELKSTFVPGAQYNWSGPNFSSSLVNPVVPEADSAQHAGIYSVFATLNGCKSAVATTKLEVLPGARRPSVVGNSPLCISGSDARLRLSLRPGTATPGALYTWSGPKGVLGSSSTTDFDLTDFSNYAEGINAFTVQATLGVCNSKTSEPFPIVFSKVPGGQAFAGADQLGCEKVPVTLNAQAPGQGTGAWSLVQGDTTGIRIVDPSLAKTLVNGLKGSNTYTFRWSLSNGACTNYSTDDINVMVSKPDTAFAGTDILACFSREIKLNAKPSTNAPGSWSQSEVQGLLGVTILDTNSPKTGVTGMQPGNLYAFTWTLRAGGCGNITDEVLVLISDPGPYAGMDQSICNTESMIQLDADKPTDGSRGRWTSLTPGVIIPNPDEINAQARNLKVGDNLFVWEVDNGICGKDSRDTVIITYKRSPKAVKDEVVGGFGVDIPINVLLNDTIPANTQVKVIREPFNGALVAKGNGLFTYTPRTNFVGKDKFTYELCSVGCDCSQAEVEIEIGADINCKIPSVITPNNDQINDVFTIPCLLDASQYPESQVVIFNRWGDEVYRSGKPYKNTWSGTYNGEDLPADTYFYIVNFGKGEKPKNGFLVIQR